VWMWLEYLLSYFEPRKWVVFFVGAFVAVLVAGMPSIVVVAARRLIRDPYRQFYGQWFIYAYREYTQSRQPSTVSQAVMRVQRSFTQRSSRVKVHVIPMDRVPKLKFRGTLTKTKKLLMVETRLDGHPEKYFSTLPIEAIHNDLLVGAFIAFTSKIEPIVGVVVFSRNELSDDQARSVLGANKNAAVFHNYHATERKQLQSKFAQDTKSAP